MRKLRVFCREMAQIAVEWSWEGIELSCCLALAGVSSGLLTWSAILIYQAYGGVF